MTTLAKVGFALVSHEMQDDPEYAWSWHSNIATALQDAGVGHEKANRCAASFMKAVFGVDVTRCHAWQLLEETWDKPAMTEDQFRNLSVGDIVRNVGSKEGFVVTGNYGDRVTAVRSVDITNVFEWQLIRKVGV